MRAAIHCEFTDRRHMRGIRDRAVCGVARRLRVVIQSRAIAATKDAVLA